MANVSLVSVDKVYPDGVHAVRDLSLEIDDGEFMVLVGPSGCGKTTALRMIAGLEEISRGTISIGDTVVNRLEPRKRDVAMVFQNYALYPNMTVAENIGFGLRMRKTPKAESRKRVLEIARILGLTELLDRKPAVLSGGQRQRVAMGRAIVRDPKVFLMDEPLSNLDAKLRVQMRSEIARIQRELKATTIYVTHDQIEAMTMGMRVAVMRKGNLQQVGPPREIYDRPANLFVATFIGSPAMNLVHGTIIRGGDGLETKIGSQRLPIPSDRRDSGLDAYIGRNVAVGMRPEHVREPAAVTHISGRFAILRAEVTATEILGSELLVHAEIDAEPVVTEEIREVAADVDVTALAELEEVAKRRRATLLGRFEPSSAVSAGDTVELAVETRALRFFDLNTEMAIETVNPPASAPAPSADPPTRTTGLTEERAAG
jgi:multiple sugar transport system ATP-binding protein